MHDLAIRKWCSEKRRKLFATGKCLLVGPESDEFESQSRAAPKASKSIKEANSRTDDVPFGQVCASKIYESKANKFARI